MTKRNGLFASDRAAACLLACLAGSSSVPAHAQTQVTIGSLYSTGLDASGNLVAPGTFSSVDAHYRMVANTFGSTGSEAYAIPPRPDWVPADAASQWISTDPDDGSTVGAGGFYNVTYRTTFTLEPGTDLSSVVIRGKWAVDDYAYGIALNGADTGIAPYTTPFAWTAFAPEWTLPTAGLVIGTNTLDFSWRDQGGPGALRVEFTQRTAIVADTPEPGPAAALAAGLVAGLALLGARRRRTGRRQARAA